MWAQITTIVSAEPWVFVLNALLLICEGIAAGCVAAGIIWESAPIDTWRRRLSHKLVIWGVVAEVAFSLALFVSDEIVSGSQLLEIRAQQSVIASLNKELIRLESDRIFSPDAKIRLVAELKKYTGTQFDIGTVQGDPEVFRFEFQLENLLTSAGWQQIDWVGGDIILNRAGKPATGLVSASDITAGAYPEKAATLGVAAAAFAATLNAEGIRTKTEPVGEGFINKNRDVVHIVIGRKT
jgi:hypothetical protein